MPTRWIMPFEILAQLLPPPLGADADAVEERRDARLRASAPE